jgi:hypothetical protein
MKIMKKRKFIVAVSLALVMAFSVVMAYSFNTSTEVSAAQPSTRETSFDWGAFQQAAIEMRAVFPYRFPDGNIEDFDFGINFSGSFVRTNENLEINLLNANLRIVTWTEEMAEVLTRNANIVSPTEHRRFFVENSDRSTAYTLATADCGRRTVYIWDNDVAYDALVTLYIPPFDGWLFEQANIHLENGHLEMDESIKEFLAENLNISIGSGRIDTVGGENVSEVTANDTQAADLIGTWESITDSSVTMEFRQDGIVISRFGYGLPSLIEGTWYISGDSLTISKTVTVFGITSQGTGTGRFEVTADNFRMYNQDGTYQDWISVR